MDILTIKPGDKLNLKTGAQVVQLVNNSSTNESTLARMTSCSFGCEKAITVIDTAGSYPTPGYGALARLPRQMRTNNVMARCPQGRVIYFHSDFALKHIDIDALKREEAAITPRLALAQQRERSAKLEIEAIDQQMVAARVVLAVLQEEFRKLESRRNSASLHYSECKVAAKHESENMTRVQNGIQDWRDRQRWTR